MGRIFPRSGVVVKGSDWDPDYVTKGAERNPAVTKTREKDDEFEFSIPGVTLSEGGAEYLNVCWKKHESDSLAVYWKHADTTRWEGFRCVPRFETFRFWASLTGVLLWDWQLGGEDKGAVAEVLELCHLVGGVDDYDRFLSISDEIRTGITPFIDALLQDEWRCRRLVPIPKKVCLLASDAMGTRGAGVTWLHKKARVVYLQTWNRQQQLEDINVRETRAAIGTVYKAAQSLNPGTSVLFLIGTDNMTARAAVYHFFYPGNRMLTEELQGLKISLKEKYSGSVLRVMYIPGKVQAADAPSRGEVLDEDKCRESYALLQEAYMNIIQDEKKLNRAKRVR